MFDWDEWASGLELVSKYLFKANDEAFDYCSKFKAKAYNLTKINAPPWMFFKFFKLYKWRQIVKIIIYVPMSGQCFLSPFNVIDTVLVSFLST